MNSLSDKELEILRFIRNARHKQTVREIAKGLNLSPDEVEVFARGMMQKGLVKVVPGSSPAEDGFYTNPEKREEIYNLLG